MSFRSLICALTFAAGLIGAQTLDAVLGSMDKAAPGFHAMTADVKMVSFDSILQDRSTETGTLQMQKTAKDLRAVIAFTGGDQARTLALLGKDVLVYYPNVGTYQRFDLGKQGQVADQLLLLGFGSSGSDLKQSYKIQLVGADKVDGQDTSKLELIPKDADLLAHLAKVDLWIGSDGNPVQQQFFDPAPSHNWKKVTYSNINLHPSISGTLDFKLPKGSKKIADK